MLRSLHATLMQCRVQSATLAPRGPPASHLHHRENLTQVPSQFVISRLHPVTRFLPLGTTIISLRRIRRLLLLRLHLRLVLLMLAFILLLQLLFGLILPLLFNLLLEAAPLRPPVVT